MECVDGQKNHFLNLQLNIWIYAMINWLTVEDKKRRIWQLEILCMENSNIGQE